MAASELLADFGLRLDGRKCDELRQINCKLGVYGQADGSAYLEQGKHALLIAKYKSAFWDRKSIDILPPTRRQLEFCTLGVVGM